VHDIVALNKSAIKRFATKNPVFVCVISYTATCEIPGLTIAGAKPELVKYTSPADVEFLHYGHCKCVNAVPATPDGKPTPALITRTALHMANIPFLVVDAGAKVKPSIPFISFGMEPGGNIMHDNAMDESSVARAFEHGETTGRQLGKLSDLVVLGESIPGGTTTALAVLTALGIEAKFKVSSSMPDNPHNLKNSVVESAIKRAGKASSILDAIAFFGDPMMPSIAGIAGGALAAGSSVMLAGGTQMSAVLAIMKGLRKPLTRLCIGTTSYVAGDASADLADLVNAASSRVPILTCDLHLSESRKAGLRAFANGFVKEGVGAGGVSIAAMLKSKGKITGRKLMRAIEKEYETSIEATTR
jgi:uncharacterized protein (TIGR00303 family)